MVGVPGRSKGCHTCIQRRVKCDLARPACGTCQKSKRLCTGYKRKLGFVFSKDMVLADAADQNRGEETAVTNHGRWRKSGMGQHDTAKYQAGTALSLVKASVMPLPKRVPAKAAFRQQYHYTFMNDYLPAELLGSGNPQARLRPDILLQLQDMQIQSPALDAALAAFFSFRIARKNRDKNLAYQSRCTYSAALDQFQQVLRSPRSRLSDETLATCVMLALYEIAHGTAQRTPPGVDTHQEGAVALLYARGPDACASALGLNSLVAVRGFTVLKSLLLRTETFFSRREWIEKPWRLFPKTILDEITDALLELPALFRRFDQLLATEPSPAILRSKLRDIVAKCLTVDFSIRQIYERFRKSISGPVYWPELSSRASCTDDPELGKLFPISFHFPGFQVAQVVTTYWSSLISVHYQLMQTYRQLAALGSPADATRSEEKVQEHDAEWKTMVRNICQSTEYLMQDSMGELGPVSIIMLLGSCKICLIWGTTDWQRELFWIEEQMVLADVKFGPPVFESLEGETSYKQYAFLHEME